MSAVTLKRSPSFNVVWSINFNVYQMAIAIVTYADDLLKIFRIHWIHCPYH